MKKLDYHRVERLFIKGIDDMDVKQVQKDALEVLSGKQLNVVRGKRRTTVNPVVAVQVIRMIAKDLKTIKEISPPAHQKYEELKKDVQRILDSVKQITEEDWERLKSYKLQLAEKRILLLKGTDKEYQQKLIENEQKELKRKGKYFFGVNDRWEIV